MLKRLLVMPLICLALLGLLAFGLNVSSPVLAGSICTETAKVQRGDTLAAFAERYETTQADLLRLNPAIKDSHHIYAGQMLCVADEATMVTPPPLDSRIVIEALYQLSPSDEDSAWNIQPRNGLVGRRVEYLLPTLDSALFTTRTVDLEAALRRDPAPGLIVRRNESDEKYTLIFVGNGPPHLASLQITPTASIFTEQPCVSVPITQALDSEYGKVASVTLVLESADGLRFPLDVSEVDQVPIVAEALDCYRPPVDSAQNRVVLALSPVADTDSAFQATIFMWNGIFGPDGNRNRIMCASWSHQPSLFYRVLRAFRGC